MLKTTTLDALVLRLRQPGIKSNTFLAESPVNANASNGHTDDLRILFPRKFLRHLMRHTIQPSCLPHLRSPIYVVK